MKSKSVIGARICFYLGVISMVLAGLSIPMEWNIWGATPRKFLQSADTWLFMAAVILLHGIYTNQLKQIQNNKTF